MSDFIFPFKNPPLADQALFNTLDLCKSLNIDARIIFGTLLGLYRDKTYLPEDNDIDIFINCDKNKRYSLLKKISLNGGEINTIPGTLASVNIHTVIDRIFIDIWFKLRKEFIFCIGEPSYLPYKYIEVPIPEKTETFLVEAYDKWKLKIPKTAYVNKRKK